VFRQGVRQKTQLDRGASPIQSIPISGRHALPRLRARFHGSSCSMSSGSSGLGSVFRHAAPRPVRSTVSARPPVHLVSGAETIPQETAAHAAGFEGSTHSLPLYRSRMLAHPRSKLRVCGSLFFHHGGDTRARMLRPSLRLLAASRRAAGPLWP